MEASERAVVEDRARRTQGTSDDPIYRMVDRAVRSFHRGGGTLVDVGCGRGRLWEYLHDYFDSYFGADVVEYEGFPAAGDFRAIDIESGRVPLDDQTADVVVAVETIEHVENPRAFMRELKRLVRPGGLVVVSTPNQLSLLSKMTLLLNNQFNAFREAPGLYPAHITALVEIDLMRIAGETGLTDRVIRYSDSGRMPKLPFRWPRFFKGRAFSDNVLIAARRA